MNILVHTSIGIAGGLFLDTNYFIIGSLVPDIPLIYNEYKIFKYQLYFDEKQVNDFELQLYNITHSLFFSLFCCLFIDLYFAWGVFIHQIIDWFSHKGIFNTKIFYPLSRISIKEIYEKMYYYFRRI